MASKGLVRAGQRRLRFERLNERAMLACTLADPMPCLPVSEGPDSGVVGATMPVGWQPEQTSESVAEALPASPAVEASQPRIASAASAFSDETGPVAEFQLTFVDMAGNPISSIEVGESFRVVVQAYDLTSYGEGIFATYIDITYDADLASFAVMNGPTGLVGMVKNFASIPGLINNIGGSSGSGPDSDTGRWTFPTTELAFDGTFQATSPGEISFTTQPPGVSDPWESCLYPSILLFEYGFEIPLELITFGIATLDIYPQGETPAVAEIQTPASAEIPNHYSNESIGFQCSRRPSELESALPEPDVLPEPVETPETIISHPFDEIPLTTGPIDLDVVTLTPPIELPSDLPVFHPLDHPHGRVVPEDLLVHYFSPIDSNRGETTGLHSGNESSTHQAASDRWSQAEHRAANRRTTRAVDHVFREAN